MEKILTGNMKRYRIPRRSFETRGINVFDSALIDMAVRAEVLKDQMTLSIKKISVVLVLSLSSSILLKIDCSPLSTGNFVMLSKTIVT